MGHRLHGDQSRMAGQIDQRNSRGERVHELVHKANTLKQQVTKMEECLNLTENQLRQVDEKLV